MFECLGIGPFVDFSSDPIVCENKEDLILSAEADAQGDFYFVRLQRKKGTDDIWNGYWHNQFIPDYLKLVWSDEVDKATAEKNE